jgi:hypothetical protein
MAIASNIFKQLIYVPETTLGVVELEPTTTQTTATITGVTAPAAGGTYNIGDDEIKITLSSGTASTYLNIGTKIVFSNSTQVYYTTTLVDTTTTSVTIKLDRGIVIAPVIGTTTATQAWTSAGKKLKPKKLRRVSSNLDLKKESYSSNEVNSSQQIVDYRIGAQTIDGTLSAELSSYTYSEFISALLRKDFYSPEEFALTVAGTLAVAPANTVKGQGVATANVAIITPNSADQGTVGTEDAGTLASNKFAGIKVGEIFSISNVGASTATANGASVANIPLLVIAKDITTQALTVVAANTMESVTFVGGSLAIGTKFQVLGQKSFVPLSGHKKKSFQLEHYYYDISHEQPNQTDAPYSELFKGVRITQGAVKLPTSGLATVDFTVMGTSMTTPSTETVKWDRSTSTSGAWDKDKSMMETLSGDVPLDPAIDAVYSSAVGNLYIKDKKGASGQIYKVGLITSLDFTINGNGETLKVIGSTTSPDVTLGKVNVSGNASIYFQDTVFRDIFLNSEDATLIAVFTESSSNTVNSAFMSFVFPRIKTGGASKDDAQSIVMTVPFTALLADSSQGYEATTLSIQEYSQTA